MDITGLRIALFSGNYNYVRDGANQALNRLVGYLLRQGAQVRVYAPVVAEPAFPPTGDLVGAEEQLRLVTVPTINPGDMGFLHAKLGRRDDALREIERLEARGREGFGVAYDQTIIYAALGELDRGCETLARAAGEHSVHLGWMRLDPRLDPLRGHRCFTEVEKRVYPPD